MYLFIYLFTEDLLNCLSQNTSAGIETSLRAGRLRNRISISGRGKELVSLPPCGDLISEQLSLLANGYREFLPGEKQPAREADNSPVSSAEVKYAWSCASARFHGVTFI
jgi:hypothetical protein